MLHSDFDPVRPLTRREIVIDNFRGFGKLVIPKGTWVYVHANRDEIAGTSITVDAYVGGEAVYYGVQIDANDIELPPSL